MQEEQDMVNTHHRIRMLREERGLTISALAEKTGISRGAISRYENRGSPRDLATWRKLADFFQVPVLYLMGYTKPRRNGIIISLTGIPNEDAGLITETLVDTAKEELPEMAENTQIGLPRWMCKYWDILIGATGDIHSMLDRVERIRFYTAFRTMADVARMDISKHEIPLCYLRCRDFSYEGLGFDQFRNGNYLFVDDGIISFIYY